jgi:ABC-type nitrate/sulfonate/bicarbonate transport system permease component
MNSTGTRRPDAPAFITWAQAAACFAALIGLWEWGSRAQWWNPVLIPSPTDIARYLGDKPSTSAPPHDH